MKKYLFFIAFVLTTLATNAQTQKYSRVKIYTDQTGIMKLASLGIPLEGDVKEGQFVVVEISENDIAKLNANSFIYEVLIDDMASYYADRNEHPENYKTESEKTSSCTSSANNWITPSHFVLGSMGGFYTITEMLAQLDSMRIHYPNLITVKQHVGTTTTIEGRNLFYVKISDNVDVDESEPKVLYSALTHAREPMGMQELVFYMWYLLENYSTNTEIQKLLDNTELYFVPIVNPDGYEYNHTTDPSGGGLWRKNRRNNGSSSYGVDLNRNYGNHWGYDNVGSSATSTDETYRGTAGFSEPETQIMKWFCENHNFTLAIDYHCYSNLLIYPWSFVADSLTSDSLLYNVYSKLMVQENGYVYGTPNQTVGYTGNGGSVDWFYGEQSTKNKIICWSPEAGDLNDGFWPASNRIVVIAKTNLLQNLYVARFAGRYAEAHDLASSVITQQNGYFKFDIERLGLAAATFTVSMQPITSTIQSIGSQKVFSGMSVLETRTDSISYTFNSTIQNGDVLQYLLVLDNGLYTVSDTITKIYGQPVVAFSDNCSATANWTMGNWGITSAQYHTPTSSITDSPSGNYASNANKSITLSGTIDLTSVASARLNFWTKWDIEAGYDYVQVKVSIDGGTSWTPLCGKYTKTGSSNQISGSPLYDGTQTTWVQEDIDLADFIGHTIKLRFALVSDGGVNADGYYFDDITVTKINPSYTTVDEYSNDSFISDPVPNPAENSTTIKYKISESLANPELTVYNEVGQVVMIIPILSRQGAATLDLSGLQKGVYYCRLTAKNTLKGFKKIVVM